MGRSGVLLRRLRAAWAAEPTEFHWIDPGKLAASGYPASRRQILWLGAQGIDDILTLTEDPLPAEWLAGTGIRNTHVPMKDHAPPELSSLDKAVDEIVERAASGDRILVHCLAGRGRTMCVLAAYAMKTRSLNVDGAIAWVRKFRSDAIEPGQEAALSRYFSALQKRS